MLRRCIRGGRGLGVDEPTMDDRDEHDAVLRRLSQLAGAGARRAPSMPPAPVAAAAADGASLPPVATSPPSFLVNMSAATPNSTTVPPQGAASFTSTPTLVRMTSASALLGRSASSAFVAAAAAAAARLPAPAPAPASDLLPAERSLVWTPSKSRREAWLLQEAKAAAMLQQRDAGGAGAMSGVHEEEQEQEGEGGGQGGEVQAAAAAGPGGDHDGDDEGDTDDTDDMDDEDSGFGGDGPYGAPEDRLRLRRRLKRLGLALQRCVGDGACLFRAVSAQLYGGDQAHHAAVRAAAVQHMADRRADYEAFLGEDVGAYLAGMARNETWGDELVLRAVSDALAVVVHVVTSDAGGGWYTVYEPEEGQGQQQQQQGQQQQGQGQQQVKGGQQQAQGQQPQQQQPPPEIFLAYLAPVHYDSLAPARPRGEQQGRRRREGGSVQAQQQQQQQRREGVAPDAGETMPPALNPVCSAEA